MGRHPIDTTFDKIFDSVMRDAVGLSNTFEQLSLPKTTFPPHNIVKLDDTSYQIELAVAGFKRSELEVKVKENTLIVTANKIEDGVTREYTYKGIGTRNFTKEFLLGNDVIVSGADIVDGLLVIDLQRVIPDHKKERVISIGASTKTDPDLLLG